MILRTLILRKHFGFLWRVLLLDGSTVIATTYGLSAATAVGRGVEANLAHGGNTFHLIRHGMPREES